METILDLLNSDHFNYFRFANLIRDEEAAIAAAYDLQLLPTDVTCPDCMRPMSQERRDDYPLGFRWRCRIRRCNRSGRTVSSVANTFFERSHLSVLTILKLTICWFFRMSVTDAATQCEVQSHAAVDFYSYCREVCRVAHSHDEVQIGGVGDVVEVDESHLFTRMYHRGRRLRRAMWVFGGISRLTRKRFVCLIRDKRRDTLWPLMQQHIAQGTFIMSDQHRTYFGCDSLGFSGHCYVNHSQRFVRQLPAWVPNGHRRLGRVVPNLGLTRVQVHTNTLERSWRFLKQGLRTCRSVPMLPNYIGEYLYRNNILRQIGKHRRFDGRKFLRFMQDVRRVYPGFDVNQIRTENCQCETCEP